MENINSTKQETQEQLRIADYFMIAMFSPKEYGKIMRAKKGKLIQFLLILMLLISLIQYAVPVLAAVAGMGGIKSIIMNELPDFSLKNGELSIDEKIEQKDRDLKVYVLVDTKVDRFTEKDIPSDMIQVLLVSKSNMLVYNNIQGMNKTVQEDKFERYKGLDLDNKKLAKATPFVYITLFIAFIFAYAFTFAKYLFMGLIFAGMTFVLVKGLTLDLSFKKVYKIAMYAQTIGILVEAVTTCIGSSLFIIGGTVFSMFITVFIMNRVVLYFKINEQGMRG